MTYMSLAEIAIERTVTTLEQAEITFKSSNNNIHIHFKQGSMHYNIWPTTYKYQRVQGTKKVNFNNLDSLIADYKFQGEQHDIT